MNFHIGAVAHLLLTCIVIISFICVCNSLGLQLILEPFSSLHAGLTESHPLFKTWMLWVVVLQDTSYSAYAICSWHSLYKQQLQKQQYVSRWLQVPPLRLIFNPSLILLCPNSLFIYYTFIKFTQGSTTKFMITCNRTVGRVTNSMLVLQARKACKKRWFDWVHFGAQLQKRCLFIMCEFAWFFIPTPNCCEENAPDIFH